jgi:alginate O-acetyltransferase complex protein AlgI
MLFSTNVFLFLFLPLFLALYYLTPFRYKSLLILVASYLFYGWWRADFLLLFFAVTLWSYLAGRIISGSEDPRRAKAALVAGVTANLLALGYFKYFNFGVDSLNAVMAGVGLEPFTAWRVILPIGLSFYIFQAISYVVDVYRKDAPPARTFWDLSAFIALFPQLIAGPVLRYKHLAGQFKRRSHTLEKFSEGAMRFMVGFCKKVLIADAVAPLVEASFNQPDPTMADAWLGAVAYTVQLYFDFSGYSDMAIGLGLMMGFRFMENFNHPYTSRSITEFWQRWHISLSRWLRDYLYIPLGGNRKGAQRTYLNLMLVMLFGGLWHGANWTFVAWGGWHGLWLAVERVMGSRGLTKPLPAVLTVPGTLLVVVTGWVLFRAPSLGDAVEVYRGMLGQNGVALSDAVAWQAQPDRLAALVLALVLIFAGPLWQGWLARLPAERRWAMMNLHLLILPFFVLGVFRLSAQSYSPFLYFQF